jgi:hypothetical protein
MRKPSDDRIVSHVLKNGTRVSLLVRVHSPAKRDYVIERTIPNAPVVKDDIGTVLPLKPTDIIPRAQVFGQHEISELTKDPEKLTRLLDRFFSWTSSVTLPSMNARKMRWMMRASSGTMTSGTHPRAASPSSRTWTPLWARFRAHSRMAHLRRRLRGYPSRVSGDGSNFNTMYANLPWLRHRAGRPPPAHDP